MIDQAVVRLRGRPARLRAVTTLTGELPGPAHLEIVSSELRRITPEEPLRVASAGSGRWSLEVSLPELTPPGEYEAAVRVGAQRTKAVLVVEPHRSHRIEPGRFSERVAPGSTTFLDVVLFNRGNVPFEVGKAHVFGLYRDGAVAHAITAAYLDPKARGLDRVGVLADRLAERFALVRLAVQPAPLRIEPGESATARLELRWPENLEAGARYTGTWPIGTRNVGVVVEVVAAGDQGPDHDDDKNDIDRKGGRRARR